MKTVAQNKKLQFSQKHCVKYLVIIFYFAVVGTYIWS